MRTHRSWSATARGLQGPEATGGFVPCAGTLTCALPADLPGLLSAEDPLVITMKPGDTYILEGERVLTATSPQGA